MLCMMVYGGIGYRFFFFKQKTAYEIMPSLVGSEMCIRDREKVVEILEMELEVQDKPETAAFVPREGALAVEHLDFAYTPHGPKIINDPVSYTHLRAHE